MSIARRRVQGKGADEWPVVIRYTGRDGKRHQETIKSGLKKDAQRRLREIEIEKEKGIHVPKSQTENMAFLFKLWLDHYEGTVNRGINSRGTFDNYRSDVRLHLLPEFGGTLITRFEALHAQYFVDQMMHKRPFKRDGSGKRESSGPYYGIKALRSFTIPLKLALDFAVDHKLVGRNVLRDRPIRFPEPPPDEREWMDLEDGRKILVVLDYRKADGIKGDDNALLWRNQNMVILIMMFCGLREAEACGVQWESVDLSERLLHVRHQMGRDGRITARLKSKSARRSIPINEILYQALIKHALRPEDRFGCVVRNTRNQPMRTDIVISRIIPKVMKRAGLVKEDGSHKFTAHQLRHFAGSIWLAEGMPLDEVSRLLGHSRIETTRKIYIHQLQHDTRAREAMERVGALITGRPMPTALPPAPPVPLRIEHQSAEQGVPDVANGMQPAVMATENGPAAPLDFTTEGFREMQRQHALELWDNAHMSATEIAKKIGVTNYCVTEWIQQARGNLRRAVLRQHRYDNLTEEQHEKRRRYNREAYRRRRGLTPERAAELDRKLGLPPEEIGETVSRDVASE